MKHTFNLNYAPHFGSFENLAGKDLFDQLKFMADQGFQAFEDSGRVGENFARAFGVGIVGQPPELLDKIGSTLANLGMEMGTFVLPPAFWRLRGASRHRGTASSRARTAADLPRRPSPS